jgi:hypothetical protein
MSAPAMAGVDRPSLRIRGTAYPLLLPSWRDPRLHLAAIIVTLQVLGQVAFDFRLSIAQILVSLVTAAVLEVAIAFRSQRVLMWPASALLTGNGVAFILRVPGTEHGDWWSMNGWWIFMATSAVSLLSKYLIRVRGRHVFNPSNFGLVLCFLLLGAARADPLALWWGPLSPALVLALVLIVVGGFLILRRLQLVGVAVGFWLSFAVGIAVLAASGHTMTAPWHVGPIEGRDFWLLLVTSPEILVFLFFMITDPRTIPSGRLGRRVYAVAVGLLATVLIAPQTTEYATKVAILGALFAVCAIRGVIELVGSERLAAIAPRKPRRALVGTVALAGAIVYGGLVVAAGVPARPEAGSEAARAGVQTLPAIEVAQAQGIADIDEGTAQAIARDIVVDLRTELAALRQRNESLAAEAATGEWLAALWNRIRDTSTEVTAARYDVDHMRLRMQLSGGQGPPHVVAVLRGTQTASASTPDGATPVAATARPFTRTLQLVLQDGAYRIVHSKGGVALGGSPVGTPAGGGTLGGASLHEVAHQVGLDFRQGAFRFDMSSDTTAMMGGGLCWLDYDSDGWLDLFVVNSFSQADISAWEARGGLPRSALYHNVGGRFEDVSASANADLPVRGDGCVAADFDLDGHTDLFVTSAGYNVPTDGYDALLWNDGDGTFTEGAESAGITEPGWHTGAAVGDVNGDGLPDLFVAGYTDPNWPLPASAAGFPTNHHAVRDLLYLNEGVGASGHATFREVGRTAGIEPKGPAHGLGAVFTDIDGDGRLDLYVANDADPNQLYLNVARAGGATADPAGLGFRLEESAKRWRLDDPNAGMGIAAADVSLDGRPDLVVTNSRGQLHAAYRSRVSARGPAYVDDRPALSTAIGTRSTGWGASWADLDLDGDLDLAVANGAIPVLDLARNAQRVQVLENLGVRKGESRFALADRALRTSRVPRVNGRGLAVADYDNDGDVDLAVNSIGGRLLLFENRGARGHWLEVELAEFSPGAVVTVLLADGRRLVREVQAGSSYLSSEDSRVHFGLGDAARVRELRVRFPDGNTVRRRGLRADRIVVVDR